MKVIVITNRTLCQGDFLSRIEAIAQAAPHAILLREKDLCFSGYKALAEECSIICKKYNTPLILNTFWKSAKELSLPAIHVPFDIFAEKPELKNSFQTVGVSVHTKKEAVFAEQHSASYLIAGHIFETDCKKGLAPRGLDFLQSICNAVNIPVYAIGGITEQNAEDTIKFGASGICIMSGLMQCKNPAEELKKFCGPMSF